jgi:hypothetical protein
MESHGATARLSHAYPEQFARYMELFVNYSPKKTFNIKETYTSGFSMRKRKNKDLPLPLFPKIAVETVEHHLDSKRWLDCQQSSKPDKIFPDNPIWLALDPAHKTRFDVLDVDAKEYLVGYYSPSNSVRNGRPVMFLRLPYFQKLRKIYESFPDRIWCISSETLGVHCWKKHQTLQTTIEVHTRQKNDLAAIGLSNIEVHPMIGRCFRRPFGSDYKTITCNGVYDDWREQLMHFDGPNPPSPSFRQIVLALLKSMIRQAKAWSSNNFSFDKNKARIYELEIRPIKEKIKQEIKLIYDWLNTGCCLSETEQPKEQNDTSSIITNTIIASSCVANSSIIGKNDWYHTVLRYAINGLEEHDSFFEVIHNLTKWLYWIDLYDLPEQQRTNLIKNLLSEFILQKNNGFITRLSNGNEKEVYEQLFRIIKGVSEINNSFSLDVFYNIRTKIKNNKYANKTRIIDLINGLNFGTPRLLTHMCMPPEKTDIPSNQLPEGIENRIMEKQGMKKVFELARVLINKLISCGGKARLGRQWFTSQGFKDPNKTKERIDVLISAGVIRRGDNYSKGRFGKEYSIPESLLNEHWPHLAK